MSWQSVLLVAETEYPLKTTDLSQVTYKIYHIAVSSTPRHERGSNSQRDFKMELKCDNKMGYGLL